MTAEGMLEVQLYLLKCNPARIAVEEVRITHRSLLLLAKAPADVDCAR